VLVTAILDSSLSSTSAGLFSSGIANPDRIGLVTLNGKFNRFHSETLLDLASVWKESKQLNGVAPFSWGPTQMSGMTKTIPVLSARVAPELFNLLGIKPVLGRAFRLGDGASCSNCVLLSHEIWKLQFRSDPRVIGRHIELAGRDGIVIGVLPADFHLLSNHIAAWAPLDSATPAFTNFVNRMGAVVRRNEGATWGAVRADLVDRAENDVYVLPTLPLEAVSVRAQWRRSLQAYFALLLVAVGCMVAIVCMRQGSANFGQPSATGSNRFHWWAFFLGKAGLLLVAVYLGASVLVYKASVFLIGSVHPLADEITAWLFLPAAIAVLTWAIRDQQQRCRSCLRRLALPVNIGRTGCVLLNWSGTEMVCSEGHGVLYLPDSQANWLERDHWNSLDESWSSLIRQSETQS
jgi:hypothetical protein